MIDRDVEITQHHEVIEKAARRMRIDEQGLIAILEPHKRWQFQQQWAELRFSMLQFLIANEKVPVEEASFDLYIQINQRAVSDRITDAMKGRIKVDTSRGYVIWQEYNVGHEWLDLTPKEKSYGG